VTAGELVALEAEAALEVLGADVDGTSVAVGCCVWTEQAVNKSAVVAELATATTIVRSKGRIHDPPGSDNVKRSRRRCMTRAGTD
jgi:hypothetical protein